MSAKNSPTPQAKAAQNVEIRGVFSTQEIRKVGTGTTTRKSVHKSFWFVEQHGDDIECQPLNTNYVPSGPKRHITMDELIAKFSPEPEFYMNSVYPKMQELQDTLEKGDKHREKDETFAAELEYTRALKIDKENVQANFGIGLTYLERGDTEKAQNIFERLVNLEGAFEAEHKHLFNEFGINLRKNKMLDASVKYYQRALQLSAGDENLHMNLARVFLETKDINSCVNHLLDALKIAPRHESSLKFLGWMIQKNLVPPDRQAEVKEVLQAVAQAAQASPAKPPAAQGSAGAQENKQAQAPKSISAIMQEQEQAKNPSASAAKPVQAAQPGPAAAAAAPPSSNP